MGKGKCPTFLGDSNFLKWGYWDIGPTGAGLLVGNHFCIYTSDPKLDKKGQKSSPLQNEPKVV